MKKIIISGVLLMMLSSMAFARGADRDCRDYDKPGRDGGAFHRVLGKLDLSDRQEDLIFDIKKAYRKKSKPVLKEKMKLKNELKAELSSEVVNKEKVKSLIKKMGKLSTRLHLIKMDELFDVHDVLTPEQKRKLKSLRKDMYKRKRKN